MLNINQFRQLIIKPSLYCINAWSQDAEELLVFTCAVESLGGIYLGQINGPAQGIYQMEPDTHNDIWWNYINGNHSLLAMLSTNMDVTKMPSSNRMIYDLAYATAMARIHYLRVTKKLPHHNDDDAIWEYYKKYYNTENGKADKVTSLLRYHTFMRSHQDSY